MVVESEHEQQIPFDESNRIQDTSFNRLDHYKSVDRTINARDAIY